jgi:hypothetical protein
MTTTTARVREHNGVPGLIDRIKPALANIAPNGQMLTVAQLAPLDQFHLRGIFATSELACAAHIELSTRVLDLGCGIGGPVRYLSATLGCKVTESRPEPTQRSPWTSDSERALYFQSERSCTVMMSLSDQRQEPDLPTKDRQ